MARSISSCGRRPLVDRCVGALETEAPPAVSCKDEDLSYVEINRRRVYFTGHTLVGMRLV